MMTTFCQNLHCLDATMRIHGFASIPQSEHATVATLTASSVYMSNFPGSKGPRAPSKINDDAEGPWAFGNT